MKPWIQVGCPVCNQKVLEPVFRHCGVDVRLHRPKGRQFPCRIAILPDTQGHRHRVWPLPSGMSLEDGYQWAMDRDRQQRAA